MYAVIKTGGKQYRVQPGDLLVVEKLEGDVGAAVSFDQVLMLGGDGGELTVGAPIIAGAVVKGTLIETRKGEKLKIFKKIRRQGYRRTRGHRQFETVIRVTGLEGAGVSEKWDGKVDLTPRSELTLRARNLAKRGVEAALSPAPAKAPAPPSAPPVEAKAAAPKKEAAPKAAAPKKEAAPKAATSDEAPKKAAAPKKPAAPKGDKA